MLPLGIISSVSGFAFSRFYLRAWSRRRGPLDVGSVKLNWTTEKISGLFTRDAAATAGEHLNEDKSLTITLEIPNSQEKELREIASQRGQDPEAFLLSLLDEAVLFRDMEPIPDDDPEEYAATVAGIQRGLDDFAVGRHRPAKEFFADIEAKYGISS